MTDDIYEAISDAESRVLMKAIGTVLRCLREARRRSTASSEIPRDTLEVFEEELRDAYDYEGSKRP